MVIGVCYLIPIIRCHVQYPASFGVIGHFIMREIIKRDMDHEHLRISQAPGPFPRDEYEYLLDKEVTEAYVKTVAEDRTILSITTVPYIKPKPAYQLLYTDWEATKIPSFYKKSTDVVDVIIVPSQFAKNAFLRGSTSRPVRVVPHGIDTDILPIQPEPDGKFTFISIGADDWRKGFDVLIEAYRQEFTHKEATLKIRSSMQIPNIKGIVSERSKVPFSQTGDMYKGAHAFVLPSRGEGFGMPYLEALASGLPVIATDGSAQVEFLGNDFFPIEVTGPAFREGHGVEYDTIEYLEPSVQSVRQQMRFVYDNYQYARKETIRGTIRVREDYTWSKTLDKILELM